MRDYTTANWGVAPHNRQSFQQMQSLFPTARLRRGEGGATDLPARPQDLTSVVYDGVDGSRRSFGDLLKHSYNDAFLVVKDGVLVAEHYDNGMSADSLHLINSISKSFLGMLAGVMAAQGRIDPERRVAAYLPEFAENAFAQTTVRQLLDMTAAVAFGEEYDNPTDDFWVETSVVGWRPALVTAETPRSLFDYALSRTQKSQQDGGGFDYRTLLTNVLGMVIERAAGRPLQELMERTLIQKLGFEQDCNVVVDPTGFPYFGAGMSVCARDLARFGLMLMNQGRANGGQVVPEAWIAETIQGAPSLRASFAETKFGEGLPGGHYSNQCFAHADLQVLVCLGIYGQIIVVDPKARFVAVKLTSHPAPADQTFYGEVFSAIFALSAALS